MTRQPFPETGRDWSDLRSEMQALKTGDVDWQNGRVPLYVFRSDQTTYDVGKQAFFDFFSENALGRNRAFPSIRKMERDVLDFGLSLMSAPDDADGAFTTGGSESILVAMKMAREKKRAGKATGDGRMNIVAATTVHPAFDKAADLMDMEVRRGAISEDGRADPATLRALIDGNTVAIVGSAPCFPHGVVDPIAALSDLALETGIWLHVDACVGGWMAPFFTMNGRATPTFDFRHPGVRSISADLHKFGFCPKPASTVFARDGEDLARASFVSGPWPNGRFETSTLVGTRPGGAVAAAWAVLHHLGVEGYRDIARRLAEMTDAYVAGIEAVPGLKMHAVPDLSIINFGSDEVDIFAVADEMSRGGWLPGLTNAPRGMHAMMSLFHDPARDDYLTDLRRAVEVVRKDHRQTSTQATY
ncbi:aspartate aminotransferase family protein [Primorskyibacter flagellatus]|uniref:Aspartate aminotransferase family protein n=1 Tax=Primorskyibacter flagellatus TaxID=1387277 RepID=A0A917AH61_9RHOB|nr:aminotransferase class V-fold PLP-dependent enzyme [Primorskyibacter flagellatus]GGE50265.1 aspartate aminotransferase family protein [Primorskyibacter flagellatus]